jgi:hypothetical protein
MSTFHTPAELAGRARLWRLGFAGRGGPAPTCRVLEYVRLRDVDGAWRRIRGARCGVSNRPTQSFLSGRPSMLNLRQISARFPEDRESVRYNGDAEISCTARSPAYCPPALMTRAQSTRGSSVSSRAACRSRASTSSARASRRTSSSSSSTRRSAASPSHATCARRASTPRRRGRTHPMRRSSNCANTARLRTVRFLRCVHGRG